MKEESNQMASSKKNIHGHGLLFMICQSWGFHYKESSGWVACALKLELTKEKDDTSWRALRIYGNEILDCWNLLLLQLMQIHKFHLNVAMLLETRNRKRNGKRERYEKNPMIHGFSDILITYNYLFHNTHSLSLWIYVCGAMH